MTENATAGGYNRLACVIFPSSAGSTGLQIHKSCITGEVDLKHLRLHLKSIHECHSVQCAKPCEIPAHCLSDTIKDIVKIRKRRGGTVTDTWIEMFKQAYPSHESIPAPYLPCQGQLLALTQHPTEEFIKKLGSAFANNQRAGMDIQPHEMAHNFCHFYSTFYEFVSRTGALPNSQIGLQLVANIEQQGAGLSPGHQHGLQLFEPSLDNGSGVATSATQQDFVQDTDTAIDMPDCDCSMQPLLCQKCVTKEFNRFCSYHDLQNENN